MNKKLDIVTPLIAVASVAVIAIYMGIVAHLWRQGLFDLPEDEAGARVLAAVLALLGGLFAALLTFAGALLKYSLDARAEDRLRLDTFIQAAGLLATDAGAPAPKTQQAAALFTLIHLNHLQFALTLLREMWPSESVSPSTAVWLIDKCLSSKDQNLQWEAANILTENAEILSTPGGCFHWPQVIEDNWPSNLGLDAAQAIMHALYRCLRSRPVADWDVTCLNQVIVNLVETRSKEKDLRVRSTATLFLSVLLRNKGVKKGDAIALAEGRTLDLTDLASEIDQAITEAKATASRQAVDRATKLEQWAGLSASLGSSEAQGGLGLWLLWRIKRSFSPRLTWPCWRRSTRGPTRGKNQMHKPKGVS